MGRRQARERKTKKRERTSGSSGGGRALGKTVHSLDEHNLKQFRDQLLPLGLEVTNVEADGNCLFRAVSDQLYGNEDSATELRKQCVDYIEENKEHFQPFVEDDRDFDDYVSDMRKDGAWAGNLELQALSKLLEVNIRVHQLHQDGPVFDIRNFTGSHARVLHLSYHSNEHYASVRPVGTSFDGPALHKPLPGMSGKKPSDAEVVAKRANILLKDAKEVLAACSGDTEAAIEALNAGKQRSASSDLTRSRSGTTTESGKSQGSLNSNWDSVSSDKFRKLAKSAHEQKVNKKKERKRRKRLERERLAKEAKTTGSEQKLKDEQLQLQTALSI